MTKHTLSDLELTRPAIANHIVREWSSAHQGGESWAYLCGLLNGFYVAGSWEGSARSDLLMVASMAHDHALEVDAWQ